jgi:predicted transcriptional regulator
MDQFLKELQIERELEEAEADIEAGRVFTHKEVEQMVREWQKSYGDHGSEIQEEMP